MSIFRSEEMGYYHIAMSKESAYEILDFLGESDSIQFVDMNQNEPLYHRAFSKDVKRCEDLELKLDQIKKEMIKRKIPITYATDIKQFLHKLNEFLRKRDKPEYTFIDDIEQELASRSKLLFDQTQALENLKEQKYTLIEQRAVLAQCKSIISDNNYFGGQNEQDQGGFQFSSNLGLSYVCGTILTDDSQRFKKIIFRATKGNNWTITTPMDQTKVEAGEFDINLDPNETSRPNKTIFMIVFTAGNNNFLRSKIGRICDTFGTQRFGLPATQRGFIDKIEEIDIQVKDVEKLIQLTEQKIRQLLYEWSLKRGEQLPGDNKAEQICSLVEEIRLFVIKEKQIWIQMNLLDYKSSIYNGYYWCPISEQKKVRDYVKGLLARKPHLPHCNIESFNIPAHLTPPTHFKLNEFTSIFQQIVDTYGVPRYREVNPGFFVPAMFPFKFGVMFGDIGHGGLLFLAGIALCKKKDELMKTALAPILEGRYLILLMGFFAFYCGIIYNDFFSLTFNFFGSCFENQEDGTTKHIKGCVYPIGLDPKWYIASNELTYFNSFKMKAAVIIGVIQMAWGVILKGLNAIHFKSWLDFWFEFIPQIIFLTVTFGYMDFLIIFKWLSDFSGEASSRAPSIVNQMINLPLKLGSTEGFPLWNQENQEFLQANLLYISLICVPLMLVFKPLILLCQNLGKKSKKAKVDSKKKPLLSNSDVELAEQLKEQSKKAAVVAQPSHGAGGHGGHGGHGEEFQFGEVMVHQVIETIEFVLGAISNTASYLRLWALSLAHSQLAKVFFEKSIGGGILSANVISTMIGWVLFVNCTLGVIMAMDMMECFLHAIRLQWVEFQGKFYKADGYKFNPFSFTKVIGDASVPTADASE